MYPGTELNFAGEWKTNLIASYNKYAQERDGSHIEAWKSEEREHFLSHLQAMGTEKLLEIGAGHGRDSAYFQSKGLKVVCIDFSPEMVKLCRAKNLEAYQMDFYNLNFAPGSFDAIWALNCLLHVNKSSLPTILENIKGVLKPGGIFFLGLYGGYDFEGIWDGDHYEPKRFFSFYTDEQLQEVVQRYFTITYFKCIPVNERVHFQSMILKKEEQ